MGAEAEEYEARQKELEGVAMPIMARLYQGVMPGGIVCMPGMSGMGGAASCCRPTHRVIIEEVDKFEMKGFTVVALRQNVSFFLID